MRGPNPSAPRNPRPTNPRARGWRAEDPPRRLTGLTLVELLVVIVLVSILVTTAIPVLSPGGDSRKLREASRNINAYFAAAQARAIETGRPFGVALHRLSADTDRVEDEGVCVRLSYVEVPPPYAGLDNNSLARIGEERSRLTNLKQIKLNLIRYSNDPYTSGPLPPGYEPDLTPENYFRPGDRVEIGKHSWTMVVLPYLEERNLIGTLADVDKEGYFPSSLQGGRVELVTYGLEPIGSRTPAIYPAFDQLGNEIVDPANLGLANNQQDIYTWSTPQPYKIYRQAVPVAGEPLQLPDGVAIDLFSSGSRSNRVYAPRFGTTPDDAVAQTEPVVVMFSPDGGSLDSVTMTPNEDLNNDGFPVGSARGNTITATESFAFCVGRRELIPAEVRSGRNNLLPIDPLNDLSGLGEEEALEVTQNYNWLNPDTRWVVLGSQSGTVTTVENAAISPGDADLDNDRVLSVEEQLIAVRANAPSRRSSGGR